MGLQLPGELASLLGMLGYNWPEADEEKLFQMGQHWVGFADTVQGHLDTAQTHARQVWEKNTGESVAAYRSKWTGQDAPVHNLHDGVTGAMGVGAGLTVVAGIVLALKIQVIVQLVILAIQIAQAIATAGPTLGASLAQIPIFKMITSLILDQLIGMAIGAILGG